MTMHRVLSVNEIFKRPFVLIESPESEGMGAGHYKSSTQFRYAIFGQRDSA